MRLEQIVIGAHTYIKRNYNEWRANCWLDYYYNLKGVGEEKKHPQGDFCEIITIAFNNSRVINYQIKLLKKFFVFPFRHTVYDNSSNMVESDLIETVCAKEDVGYIRLPKQLFVKKGMGSYSHGIALNWVWKNYVSKSTAKYFVILDHDIFPVKVFDVEEYLKKQPVFGLILHNKKSTRVKKTISFLWAGFSLFRMDYIKNKNIDFRPNWNLNAETGARNYDDLYRKLDMNLIARVRENKICFDNNGFWENGYAYFDCGWIHMWNGSNYTDSQKWEDKMENITAVLEEYL